MADQKPNFSFGNNAVNNNAKPAFGGAPGGGLFGGGNNANAGSGASPFSMGGNKPAGSLFGGAGAQTTPNTGGGSIFGATPTSGSNQQKPLFGAVTNSTPGSGASTPSLFGSANTGNSSSGGGFSFQKPATTSAGGGGLFGGGATTGTPAQSPAGFGFGNSTGSSGLKPPTASAAAGSTTPAPNKPSLFGALGSTTPAGPPPGGNKGGLFGAQAAQATPGAQNNPPSLFGSKPSAASSASTPSLFGAAGAGTTTPSNLFGGGANKPAQPSGLSSGFTLGGSKPASQAPSGFVTPASAPQTTQGQQPGTTPLNLFGGQTGGAQGTQPTPKGPLFNLGGAPTPASSTPASTPSTFSLGGATSQPPASQPATTSAAAPSGGSFFLGGAKPAPTTTSASPMSNMFNKPSGSGAGAANTSTGAAPSNLFGALGQGGNAPTSQAAGTSAPAASGATTAAPSNLFGGLGGSAAPATSGAATTSAAAPSNLFSTLGATGGATTSTAQPAATTATAGGLGASTTGAALGSSISGPVPTGQSRLKNKSMDEIITRWASDLSKYQKEFQTQAERVAAWDQTIMENTNKVHTLFWATHAADRDAGEIERQLTNVESAQDELGGWLDKFEREIDEMMEGQVRGGKNDLQGPDSERENTYKLAEKLSDRLNELNKDLTEMIEEVNGVSQTLSKTSKPDDPLSAVVKVLNSHLAQLQVIDTGATELQAKIADAQKEQQRLGGASGWSGLGSDPAEDFYRSFRGGRTERFGGVS
ncbi:hypothetical protein BU16DRAFT_573392 [Lophium mytilinum]|uniref:Nucleoporin NSP1-like C-terminal domain-containing protein n=1 Tax=Lophium mytilinum TaxID=390894 RepID=A0A6A6QPV4_9PEZI|nr:hypothetical protein BU16DRAFT_573392 [Lophium mytilinum]